MGSDLCRGVSPPGTDSFPREYPHPSGLRPPLRWKPAPGRWFGNGRRKNITAPTPIFFPLRPPVGPDGTARKYSWFCAPVGIPGYQNGRVFHLRPGVRSPCAYFFENGAPGSARGCWKRAAHQKTITFFATLRKYFKEILLCNNSDAMLRFCYTFP